MKHCEISVGRPLLIDANTIRYDFDTTDSIRRYFSSERMFVRYDVDVTCVPEALLLVPFLGTIAPVAWVLGADLRVPIMDESFLEALKVVKRSLRQLHPTLPWGGEIRAGTVVAGATQPGERSALLFSGGVDSLASFVKHRNEKPLLVSVWGADVGLGQLQIWERVAAANLAFARGRGSEISFLTTNFRTFFNHYKLRSRFLDGFQNWYSGIQQGLGLVTLCAPLSHTHRLKRVLIPSTHTADWGRSWGSHPTIEDNARWAHTEVLHDGYDLTRQMKLRLLADYIRNHDRHLQLRVCWGNADNCASCTKCCLTMVGLLLEGLDPRQHGFRCGAATFSHIRRRMEKGRLQLSESAVWIWMEIQRRIPTRTPIEVEGLDALLTWLQGISIRDYSERNQRLTRSKVRRYLESRPEPIGRWIRQVLGHPFP